MSEEAPIQGGPGLTVAKQAEPTPPRQQIPTKGRIVLYTLSQYDAEEIAKKRFTRSANNNPAREGQQFPAIVVSTYGDYPGAACNLRVFLDGHDMHWVTSRTEGTGDGTWMWPPRV